MLKKNKIFVICGGGGKTTLSKNNQNFIDIDNFWDINGQIESKMIKEFKEARENKNEKLVKKIIKECMNYKATKLKNELNKDNVVILVQSVEKENIISNDNNNIYFFVPSINLHESLMEKRKDSDFVKEVCRMQRKEIIDSGFKYYIYNDFKELQILIDKVI